MVKISRKILFSILILTLVFTGSFPFSPHIVRADSSADKIQNQLDDLLSKQKKAQAELAAEQSKLYKNKSQIGATQALLKQLADGIARQEEELNNLNDKAEQNRTMLAEYLRQIYYTDDNDPLVRLTLEEGKLDSISSGYDRMLDIKSKIVDALGVINDAKTESEQAKAALADKKGDSQDLLKSQQAEQNQIVGDIQDTQETIADLQKKFDELQSDLNKILGSNYNAKDIKDAVCLQSNRLAVRQAAAKGQIAGCG